LVEEMKYIDKKFGKICPRCKKRHPVFSTRGENLPKSGKIECDEK